MDMDYLSPNGSFVAQSSSEYSSTSRIEKRRRSLSCQGQAAPTSLPKPQVTCEVDSRPRPAPQLLESALAPATPQSLSPREAELSSPSATPDDGASYGASPDDSSASSAYSLDLGHSRQSLPPTLTEPQANSLRELLSRDHSKSAPQQHGAGLGIRRQSRRSSSGCTSVPTETLTYPEAEVQQRLGSSPSLARRLYSSFDIPTALPGVPQLTNSFALSPPMAPVRSTDRRHTIDGRARDAPPSKENTVTTTTAHMRNSHGQRVSVSLRKREVVAAVPANAAHPHTRSAPPKPRLHGHRERRRSKLSSIKDDDKDEGRRETNKDKGMAAEFQGDLFSIPGIVDAVTSVFSQFINPCSCSVGSSSGPSSRNQ